MVRYCVYILPAPLVVGPDNQELHHLPILTFTQTYTFLSSQNPISVPEPKPEIEYVLTFRKLVIKSKSVKKSRNLYKLSPGFKPLRLMGDGEEV